jgi:hypothetical protein
VDKFVGSLLPGVGNPQEPLARKGMIIFCANKLID